MYIIRGKARSRIHISLILNIDVVSVTNVFEKSFPRQKESAGFFTFKQHKVKTQKCTHNL